tara:strand:- start:746 stop:916 length:171 start_codon:yes stop_codon:yes gene_type:complete
MIGISAIAHNPDVDSSKVKKERIESNNPQSEIEGLDKLCEELKKLKKQLENEEKQK